MKRIASMTALSVGLLLGVAACSGDFSTDPPPPGEAMAALAGPSVTGRHVFLFRTEGSIPSGWAAAVQAAGGSVVRTHASIGVAVAAGLTDQAAQAIAGSSGTAHRDFRVQWVPTLQQARARVVPLSSGAGPRSHDPSSAFFFPFQWNMRTIRANEAWNAGFVGSEAVRVAIRDTGIDPFHIDLAGRIDLGRSVAFESSVSPGPTWGDDHFHGTHVAGTVVTNGLGTSGVAPHVRLIAVKVLDFTGFGTFEGVIGGILHAADVGADVINMSLGAGFQRNDPNFQGLLAAFERAVGYATRSGALVVAAAGNDNFNLQRSGSIVAVPCESTSAICVSATGPSDLKASYSNFGVQAIDVAAPGGDFIVTGVVENSTVMAPCSSLIPGDPCPGGVFYVFAQGTSMAAPHVSGLAALLDSRHEGALRPAQLRRLIERSAVDLGRVGADAIYGKGRIDACAALGC